MNRENLMLQRPSKWRKSVLFSDCFNDLPAIHIEELYTPAPLQIMFSTLIARGNPTTDNVDNERHIPAGMSQA